MFAAIADPVRRDILTLLANRPAAAGVVAEAFGDISRPAVSRHLRVLRETGLVRAESHGRRQVYTATITPLREVIDWIDGLAPRIIDRLDALETEVYRTRRDRTASGSSNPSTEANEELTA